MLVPSFGEKQAELNRRTRNIFLCIYFWSYLSTREEKKDSLALCIIVFFAETKKAAKTIIVSVKNTQSYMYTYSRTISLEIYFFAGLFELFNPSWSFMSVVFKQQQKNLVIFIRFLCLVWKTSICFIPQMNRTNLKIQWRILTIKLNRDRSSFLEDGLIEREIW